MPSSIPLLQLACASNHLNLQCWQAIALNNGTDVLINCYPEPGSGSEMNTQSTPNANQNEERTCSMQCAGALNQLRAQHGCCVTNAFNTSTFGLLELGVASYNLWSSCNVQTTSVCPQPRFVNIFAEATTTDSSGTMVTVSIVMVILVVLIMITMLF